MTLPEHLRSFAARLLIALVVAAVLMTGAVVAANEVVNSKINRIQRVPPTELSLPKPPPGGANYLVVGSDTRAFAETPEEAQAFGSPSQVGDARSDTIMVLHVEPSAQKTLVVSFPRDLKVNIDGYGYTRINTAFNDGPQKVADTITKNFKIPIHHYIEINFKSFQGIVDAVGGVPVYVPWQSRDEYTGWSVDIPGCYNLNGQQALQWVRARHMERWDPVTRNWVLVDVQSDINRIQRQQDFIRRMMSVAVAEGLSNPFTASHVADRVVENLKVDSTLSKSEMLDLVDAFRTVNAYDPGRVEFETFPWKESGDGATLVVDNALGPLVAARLADFSGDVPPPITLNPSQVTLEVRNASGKTGAARAALDALLKQGFKGNRAIDDPRGRVAENEVRYRPDRIATAIAVSRVMVPAPKLVADPTVTDVDVVLVLGTSFESLVDLATTPASVASAAATTTTTTSPPPVSIANRNGKVLAGPGECG